MDCEQCREAVSADLDAEATPDEAVAAAAHREACAACRRWADRASAVTRRARTLPVGTGPDLVGDVLAEGERPPLTPGSGASAAPGRLTLIVLDGEPVPGVAVCGCPATCRCGCQEGRACRCDHRAA